MTPRRVLHSFHLALLSTAMSSPPPRSPTNSIPISHETLAAAAERRSLQRPQTELTAAQLAAEHDRRQTFRRLVDPGIMRPNPKDQAMKSLKVH